MITHKQALEYEIRSSRWVLFMFCEFLRDIGGRYFAWKVNSKMKRYIQNTQN